MSGTVTVTLSFDELKLLVLAAQAYASQFERKTLSKNMPAAAVAAYRQAAAEMHTLVGHLSTKELV